MQAPRSLSYRTWTPLTVAVALSCVSLGCQAWRGVEKERRESIRREARPDVVRSNLEIPLPETLQRYSLRAELERVGRERPDDAARWRKAVHDFWSNRQAVADAATQVLTAPDNDIIPFIFEGMEDVYWNPYGSGTPMLETYASRVLDTMRAHIPLLQKRLEELVFVMLYHPRLSARMSAYSLVALMHYYAKNGVKWDKWVITGPAGDRLLSENDVKYYGEKLRLAGVAPATLKSEDRQRAIEDMLKKYGLDIEHFFDSKPGVRTWNGYGAHVWAAPRHHPLVSPPSWYTHVYEVQLSGEFEVCGRRVWNTKTERFAWDER